MKRGVKEGLFAGVYEAAGQALGVEHFATKTAAQHFRHHQFDSSASMLVERLFGRLENNWTPLVRKPARSSENFRWRKPRSCYRTDNHSKEVTLERNLIKALEASGNTNWSNQVPLISGITEDHRPYPQKIDLVKRRGQDAFEFVELKVDSNNPVFAAYQILIYGLLWLLSRQYRKHLGYVDNPILNAHELHLSVLAPRAYYSEYLDLIRPLATSINKGLRILGEKHCVLMTFRFTAFPKRYDRTDRPSRPELIAYLCEREPV
jgi:hypothetical protein